MIRRSLARLLFGRRASHRPGGRHRPGRAAADHSPLAPADRYLLAPTHWSDDRIALPAGEDERTVAVPADTVRRVLRELRVPRWVENDPDQ